MTDQLEGVYGPVDFILLEFPGDRPTGPAASALLDLVDAGIVRIYDLVVVRKESDGSFSGLDLSDLDAEHLGGFSAFAGARSGLLGDDDLQQAAEAIRPGTTAALIVYENSWAIPFVARERIPADVLMDVLDELDAADAAD